MLKTQVAASRLQDALETQKVVLLEEKAREEAVKGQIEETQSLLINLQKEYEASVKRQAALNQTIFLWTELESLAVDGSVPTAPAGTDSKSKPARLGKQHYRMLHAIRASKELNLADLAKISGVTLRRARQVMAEDAEEGLVGFGDGKYFLAYAGSNIMERFEEYRRSNNQPLPPLDVVEAEDDLDEPEQDAQSPVRETASSPFA